MFSPFVLFLFLMRPYTQIHQPKLSQCPSRNLSLNMLKKPSIIPVEKMDIFDRFEKYSLEQNTNLQYIYLNLIMKHIHDKLEHINDTNLTSTTD